ncbi:phosphoglycerate kinase [Marinicellulosiphila megalodicopiae]|uniref:phosphoglycerate kinase n=1 Tax=Marinicellulosiphila megalodicopiae TaxID=2724896 RepID=UPI003BB0AF50
MSVIHMSDLDLSGKRVLIRQDLNVPLDENGEITSDIRIKASLPTIKLALEKGATVMIMSHLGRPTEGEFDDAFSLKPVAANLADALDRPVPLISDWVDGIELNPGEIVLLENVRFNEGESENDLKLAKRMAKLCDVFVMDAFGTAHRAHASTEGVARFAPVACSGPLLTAELDALGKALDKPERPFVALVGGAKVSTKLNVLEALSKKVDILIVGGGISNTFVAANGNEVGNSLYEKDLIPTAQKLMKETEIIFAQDVRITKEGFGDWNHNSVTAVRATNEIAADEEIIDYGPKTVEQVSQIIKNAKTMIWNGPCGVFEFDAFANGTRDVAKAIAASDAFSVAGGGDTLAAIDKFGLSKDVSYISTGGGAFLELVEGKELPAVAILKQRAKNA